MLKNGKKRDFSQYAFRAREERGSPETAEEAH
jgi:hypothetical protein